MDARDTRIEEILRAYDEPYEGNVWKVQGKPVIYHGCLERIAVKAGFTWHEPRLWRGEEGDIAILVIGSNQEGRMEWSVGEARIGQGGNYQVTGRQPGYPWAMAEKRGKDRVILKLIQLSGLAHSSEETDDFADPQPPPEAQGQVKSPYDKVLDAIDARTAWQDVVLYMRQDKVQAALKAMPEGEREGARMHAVKRMRDLGWAQNMPRPEGAPRDPDPSEASAGTPTSRDVPPANGYRHGISPISSLPAFAAIHFSRAKTEAEADDLADDFLEQNGIDWNELSPEVQEAFNRAVSLLKGEIRKGNR